MLLIKNKIKIFLKKFKLILILGIALIISFCFLTNYLFNSISPSERYGLVNNPLGHRFLSNWHAVRKIVNLVHLPYWFEKSKLKIYHLTISPQNLRELNSSLPLNDTKTGYSYLRDKDKFYVKADFVSEADNYSDSIKVRYRGTNWNNWDARKKALRIKFPKNHYFLGQRALNLIIPYDRAYFGEPLSSYRAKKFNVLSADFDFIHLVINGGDSGVYLASEPWSKEYLARRGLIDTDNIFSNQDLYNNSTTSLFSLAGLSNWKSYTASEEVSEFPELELLMSLIEKADDEEFAQKISHLVNLDNLYKWQVINILAGSEHQNDHGNTVLVFKKETGKFELALWDVNMLKGGQNIFDKSGIMIKRVLSQEIYWQEFLKVLKKYVNNEKNLSDDLAYYDDLYNKYKIEFYKDQAKIDTDIFFDKQVKKYRQYVIDNFDNARRITRLKEFPAKIIKPKGTSEKIQMPDGFSHFNDIFLSIDEFVKNNPQFLKKDDKTILLKKGIHKFYNTLIIPAGLKLEVQAGATFRFAPGVSIISYSPVSILGTEKENVILEPLDKDSKPWGVFAVINSGNEVNKFTYVNIKGGSSAKENGVFFTSQLSLHNAKSEIYNSVFSESHSDDGMHAIKGTVLMRNSKIINNSSDGIDLDFVHDSLIENCFFYNDMAEGYNGDALDVSFVKDTVIKDNTINNFGDKGISVGEKAQINIINNTIKKCNIGIAVKDDSKAKISDNVIFDNKQNGLALYRKKQDFIRGGLAIVKNTVLWNNQEEISLDQYSSLEISSSTVMGGYNSGDNISTTWGDYKKYNK